MLVKTLPQHSYARMISLDQGWNKRGLVIPVTDSPKLISPAPGSSQLAVVAAIIFRLHLDIPICLIPCLRSCIQEKSILLPVMLHLETKHLKVNYQLPKALSTSENSKKKSDFRFLWKFPVTCLLLGIIYGSQTS